MRGDYATALAEFQNYAEQGNTTAQLSLGVMYANGEGVPEDAAEQGTALAQFSLGVMYDNGEGVPEVRLSRRREAAVCWFLIRQSRSWRHSSAPMSRPTPKPAQEGSPSAIRRLTPEGAGAVQYLGSATVERVRAWTESIGVTEGALFRRVRRGGRVIGEWALGPQAVRTIVKRRAAEAGVEGRVSGHSLRVGAGLTLDAGTLRARRTRRPGRGRATSLRPRGRG